MNLKNVKQGLDILGKYNDNMVARMEKIHVYVGKSDISKKDKDKLKELGWLPDESQTEYIY